MFKIIIMKIAFFGTPDFAGKILSWILEYSKIDCKLIISQPDKQFGRKKELRKTPVKLVWENNNIEVLQPEKIKPSLNSFPKGEMELHEKLKSLELDFIVVVAYGKIIPKAILDIPKYGCINIHGSILPKYRWASPVQSAIKAGEKETWLTTMYMSEGMDEWDILKIAKFSVDNIDTSEDIFQKFVSIWPQLLIETLQEVQTGELQWMPQNHKDATYCGKISREDGEVFFQTQLAWEIYNTYRAYIPWPGIYTYYEEKRLVLEKVKYLEWESIGQIPWTFIKISKNRYGIVCSDRNILEILWVKPEGKKSMDIQSFVNGNIQVVGFEFQ